MIVTDKRKQFNEPIFDSANTKRAKYRIDQGEVLPYVKLTECKFEGAKPDPSFSI